MLVKVSIFCVVTLFIVEFCSGYDASAKIVHKEYNNSYDDDPYDRVLEITKCLNRPREKKFHLRGKYWVFYNYVSADKSADCHKTMTYSTHADFTFLDNVLELVDRWDGPISVAVYAPGSDFKVCLRSIAYLRNCKSPKIKEKVTFHLFFDEEHFPKKSIDHPFINLYKEISYNCSKNPPYFVNKTDTFRHKHNLTYPINVGRNIARESAETHFVFPSDIELYPTRNFVRKFLKMIAENPHYSEESPKVFVLPIFEVTHDSKIPETKTELQAMLKQGKAIIFHYKLCGLCHRVPRMEEWIEAGETDGLHEFVTAKRIKKNRFWEAFYVGTHDEPLFDERLSWEGQSNKMTQAFSMCLLNYDYVILDNAFLVHKPGIKKMKDQYVNYRKIVSQTNSLIKKYIKPELIKLYGNRDECVLL